MAVISDDTHAIESASVAGLAKYDAPAPPPFDSFWYLSVQSKDCPVQMLRFEDESARDTFYKKLVDAMGS